MRVALLAVLALLILHPAGAAASGGCAPLKPTLVSEVPGEVGLHQPAPGQWYLVFRAGMTNEGRGPLRIVGKRKRAGAPMRSQQVLNCSSPTQAIKRNIGIGAMQFSRQPTHEHFHLRDIERYRLFSLADGTYENSFKRGFCMGDSYDPGIMIANKPAVGGFDGDLGSACGQAHPEALRIVEGLSVGWGDYYSPLVEGQYVDLTGLPEGDYRVVTELDPFQRLIVGSRERSVGGADFHLSYPDGTDATPEANITGSCNTRVTCASRLPWTSFVDDDGSAGLGRSQPILGGQLAETRR